MDKSVLREIHRFWFGELKGLEDVDGNRVMRWMRQSDDMDREVRDGFAHYLEPASKIEWDVESLSREEGMGLVVLFDQFPRNLFRQSGEAFAYDELARGVAKQLVARGLEQFYRMERFILTLPFQHHEDVADQDYSVWLAAGMVMNCPPEYIQGARGALDFSTKHRDLIRKFGRYPHRNAMLGRVSTPEEEAFLKEHGRGF